MYGLTDIHWYTGPNYSLSRNRVLEKSVKSDILDVLLVCRQFYFAGIEAFFSENIFNFNDLSHLTKFVDAVDLDRRRCVKSVVLQFSTAYTWRVDDLLGSQKAGEKNLAYCINKLPSLKEASSIIRSEFGRLKEKLSTFVWAVRERVDKIECICWRPFAYEIWNHNRISRLSEDGEEMPGSEWQVYREEMIVERTLSWTLPWEVGWGSYEVLFSIRR